MSEGSRPGAIASLYSRVRFGKFVSVGAIGAICDTAVLVGLTEGLGVIPELATLVGIETAILVMFAINERWTFANFGDGGRTPLLGRLKRSHLVRAGGSLTQFLIFVLIYRAFFVPVTAGNVSVIASLASAVGIAGAIEGFDLWLLVAKGTGIGVGMLVNYVAESLFTWRVGRP